MTDQTEREAVLAAHDAYFNALGQGDMDAVAETFVFPAVFKGFLDDPVIAADAAELKEAYVRLIAAAPKAERSDIRSREVALVRPGVYMLTMDYVQYGAGNAVVHQGKAVYFLKPVGDGYRLFAVI